MKTLAYSAAVALVACSGVVAAPAQAALLPVTAPVQVSPAQVSAAQPALTSTSDVRQPRLADLVADSVTVDPRVDNTKLTFFAGLPRDRQKLQAAATKAATPGLLEYRDFSSLQDAAVAYGASAKAIKKIRGAGTRTGVTVAIDKSGLFARLTASVAVWNKVFGSKAKITEPSEGFPFRTYTYQSGKDLAPAPADFKDSTVEWQSLYTIYAPVHDIQGINPASEQMLKDTLASPGTPKAWPTNTGTPIGDTCGQPALEAKAVYVPAQLLKAYGTSSLVSKGMTGKDARMTIVSMGGGYNLADIEAAAHCFGHAQPAISVRLGTGVGEQFRNDSAESHLDLITASSVIPAATSINLLEVVSSANGFTDALSLSLTPDASGASPDVVSISYGMCEADFVDDAGVLGDLNQDLMKIAAMVGTSVIVAAGDHGSTMCSATSEAPTVWYPASSPWATAVGGTRLTLGAGNVRTAETVWNDSPYMGNAQLGDVGAGAGGPSSIFGHPWYQPGPTPLGPRMVPDVALLGDIRPGWPVYYNGALYTVGGTSGGTPFLAANIALMAAAERAKGYPTLGFLNGWLYAAAVKKSPFIDITSGGNAIAPVPCCAAYTGYDMASGLGVPTMDGLLRSIIPPAG